MTKDDAGEPSYRSGRQRNRRTHRTPRRSRTLNIALSEDEFAFLSAAAERAYLATGAWAAQVLQEAAAGSTRPEYAELRELLIEVMRATGQVRRIGVNLNQAVTALNAGDPPPQLCWYAEAAARSVRKLDDLADEVRRRLP